MTPVMAAAASNPELVNKAASGIGTVVKVVGIALGVGLATFVVIKVGKMVKEKVSNKGKLDKDTAGYNESNCKLEPSQHQAIANALANAFDLDAMTQTFQNYNEESIKNQLSKIPTLDDWKAVIKVYDTRKQRWDGISHTLIEQLQLEPDNSDRAEYQKILDKIGATGIL